MAGQHRDETTTAGRDGSKGNGADSSTDTDHPGVNGRRLRRALGLGAATGIASAFPLWKIPRKPLALWSGGIAAAVATGFLILKRDQSEREAEVQGEAPTEVSRARRLGAPVVTGALFGGLMAGSMWLTSVTDEWSEKLIARLGAKRPRATYALLAGVGTALIDYFDDSPRKSGQDGKVEPGESSRKRA
ncbi:hypothetical protein LG293_12930 [Citricoccus nitrophenolicus]|uniref:Uncharacterized protein n=1 Tax=Citricoccus muralis TaxID=169134 RepID=A0A3D9LB25_9MICC|nr:hypothetical protein [Citricoccus muralis]REE02866.1 hypothetical protein C8E99_0655 [Citricoccus muralis]